MSPVASNSFLKEKTLPLSNKSLENFVSIKNLELPSYDRSKVKVGIVHLGIGGFHRSHQALYTQEVLASGDNTWGICAVGLMQHDEKICNILQTQDGLYTLLERDQNQENLKIIGSLAEVIWGFKHPQTVVDRIASPDTKIVSLTVTEKGYCFNSDGELDLSHPFIQKDISDINHPVSATGFIVSGLKLRKEQGGNGLTVLSCDNLPQNGDKTKKAILTLSKNIDVELASWIDKKCFFS